MARPLKQGIDYFSFDVDFFEDEKIEPISGEFGIKGEIIVIRLLCAVYRNGYFAMWNEQLKMTLANRCKVSSDLIEQVVSRLVKWGFVDESLFNSAKIITSKGIQKRFQEATRKRKYDYSSLDYWLLEAKKQVSSADNPRIEEFIPPKTPQSKVKESKVIISTNVDCQNLKNSDCKNLPGKDNSETKSERINYNEVVNTFHRICISYPKVQKLTDARKDKIRTRIKEFEKQFKGTHYLIVLSGLFQKMEDSDFMRGNNKSNWRATFDWIFENGKNWVKTFEGHYDNEKIQFGQQEKSKATYIVPD